MHGEAQIKPTRRKVINAVDLFCGAGGTSSGLINAVNDLGYEIKLTAINHWDVAIATHSRNHEDVQHHCQSIETLDPAKIITGGRLQLLVASPECIHHSNARGGKPRSDQKRADAWMLMRWIEKLYVENILIENVPEFESWGPLTAAGKPDKRHKGMYFQQFIAALRINYRVDWKVLNCADYGDPTTRKRLFILARRGRKKIVWPTRTHASRKEIAKLEAEGGEHNYLPWVAAKEIIDWGLEGTSIFGRKKPLADNTMRRIFAGLERYSGLPFIVPQRTQPATRDINDPAPVVTTTSRGIGVAESFQVNLKGSTRRDRDINDPTFTQAAGGNHQGVVSPFTMSMERPVTNRSVPRSVEDEPIAAITGTPRIGLIDPSAFLVSAAHGGNTNPPRDINEPLGAVLGSPKHAVVESEAFLISAGGPELDAKTVDEPMRTVLTRDHQGVVQADAFLLGQQSGGVARDVEEPVPAVAAKGAISLTEIDPFMVKQFSGSDASRTKPIDEPVGTIAANYNHHYLAEPMLVKYEDGDGQPFIVPFFGEREGQEPRTRDINDPAPTVTGHGRQGLAEPIVFNMAHTGNGTDDAAHAARCKETGEPLSTIAGKGMFGLADPMLVRMKSGQGAEPVDDPLKTLTTKESYGLADPFMLTIRGDHPQNRDIAEPVPSLLTGNHQYVVQPHLVKFYGSGVNADSVNAPLAAVTGTDRFGLVEPTVFDGKRRRRMPEDGEVGLCIPDLGIVLFVRFRMLQPHELAAAMSFPPDYQFSGNRESKVKQIGNAVPLRTAKALATVLLAK